MRAPGKEMASCSDKNILLPRRSLKRTLLLALVTVMCVASAFAGPGVQVGNQNMFRPSGMVKVTVPNPVAGGAPLTDWWVADEASGFCRLDKTGPATAPSNGILNLNTCYLPGTFAPVDYQVETSGVVTNSAGLPSTGYVFVAGIKGVTRLEFIPDPNDPTHTRTAINPATLVVIFDSTASVFANGLSVNGPRFIRDARLGPDGKLYICFQGNGDIWRVRNPLSPTFTPAGNSVERVGTSDNGRTLLSLAWVGHDLWASQAGFLNRIQNADLCNYTMPACQAMLEFGKLQTQQGLISDQFVSSVPDGRWLYWGNGNRVIRYDTFSADNMEIWNQSGFVCSVTTVDTSKTPCPISVDQFGRPLPEEYSLIFGMNWIQTKTPTQLSAPNFDGTFSSVEDMTVTTDPIIEAPPPAVAGTLPKTGKAWLYSASPSLTPESCQTSPPFNPPPCVNSQNGSDAPPVSAPSHDAARRAILLLAGVTHPRGLIWLQNNWWISEEDNGFCRINQNPITGAAFLSNCFQPAGFIPGQPAADAPDVFGNQNVYVPDASAPGRGVVRLKFNAALNTVSQTALLNSGKSTAAAVALPTGPFNDGALYIGYYDTNVINKIQKPATAPTSPIFVAGTFNGVGILSMAFMGNNLMLAELGPVGTGAGGQLIKGGQVTQIVSASPSVSKGNATLVNKPISRLQSPDPQQQNSTQVFANPAAFAVGPVGDRERCLPPLGVKLSASVPADPGTAPGLFLGGLGLSATDAVRSNSLAQPPEVDQYGSICTTMVDWVAQASLDPSLSFNAPLGPVTALAFDSQTNSQANLAIADDPGLVMAPVTQQTSKIVPPSTGLHGQGHVYIVP
jgi:hypothetical protein